MIDAVWRKAKEVENYNPDIWRQDFAGAWIRRDQYGVKSNYGWEIDHLKPLSKGGTDEMDNLCPMHWKNNRTKSDDYPDFMSSITSKENANIEEMQSWTIRE